MVNAIYYIFCIWDSYALNEQPQFSNLDVNILDKEFYILHFTFSFRRKNFSNFDNYQFEW